MRAGICDYIVSAASACFFSVGATSWLELHLRCGGGVGVVWVWCGCGCGVVWVGVVWYFLGVGVVWYFLGVSSIDIVSCGCAFMWFVPDYRNHAPRLLQPLYLRHEHELTFFALPLVRFKSPCPLSAQRRGVCGLCCFTVVACVLSSMLSVCVSSHTARMVHLALFAALRTCAACCPCTSSA